jgi:hypothetical protein
MIAPGRDIGRAGVATGGLPGTSLAGSALHYCAGHGDHDAARNR